jgi:hypothetical protein
MNQFKHINEVPQGLRKLRGYPLSLDQINEIFAFAIKISTGPQDFAACIGGARRAFTDGYSVKNDVWVRK